MQSEGTEMAKIACSRHVKEMTGSSNVVGLSEQVKDSGVKVNDSLRL